MNEVTGKYQIQLFIIEEGEAHFEEYKFFAKDDHLLIELQNRAKDGKDLRKALFNQVLKEFFKLDSTPESLWVERQEVINPRLIQTY